MNLKRSCRLTSLTQHTRRINSSVGKVDSGWTSISIDMSEIRTTSTMRLDTLKTTRLEPGFAQNQATGPLVAPGFENAEANSAHGLSRIKPSALKWALLLGPHASPRARLSYGTFGIRPRHAGTRAVPASALPLFGRLTKGKLSRSAVRINKCAATDLSLRQP